MKPLFLSFSNPREPYLTFVKRLEENVGRLDVGDFQFVEVNPPGENANFFTISGCLLYSYIIKAINLRPIIILDCDNEIKRPLPNIFEADWDIAACYRKPISNECGRHDYNSGLIALNNKRPDIIRKFWVEWINKTELWEKVSSKIFPETLRIDGWRPCWYSKQCSLNQIILPEDRAYKITPGQSYISHGYKIMPLARNLYGAKPGRKSAFIIHHKGGKKRK